MKIIDGVFNKFQDRSVRQISFSQNYKCNQIAPSKVTKMSHVSRNIKIFSYMTFLNTSSYLKNLDDVTILLPINVKNKVPATENKAG